MLLSQVGGSGDTCPLSVLAAEEREALVERVVGSAAFNKAPRLRRFFIHVAGCALANRPDEATEQQIGIRVFDRPPGYNANGDNIVRSQARLLRLKLEHHFATEGKDEPVIIVIPKGQYLPVFEWRGAEGAGGTAQTSADGDSEASVQLRLEPTIAPARARLKWLGVAAGGVFAVTLTAVLVWRFASAGEAIERFWNPLLSAPGPALICVGNTMGALTASGGEQPRILTLRDFYKHPHQAIYVDDATVLGSFTALLQESGKPFRVMTQAQVTYSDLQNGPAILIGLLNNNWTGRVIGPLRFRVEFDGPDKVIIRDRKNPKNNAWSIDYSRPYLEITKDYAVVVREIDPRTGQAVVTVGGISAFGTLAAGQFLTNPAELKLFDKIAPPGWENRNFELVLSTDVIRGHSGRATLVAAEFW